MQKLPPNSCRIFRVFSLCWCCGKGSPCAGRAVSPRRSAGLGTVLPSAPARQRNSLSRAAGPFHAAGIPCWALSFACGYSTTLHENTGFIVLTGEQTLLPWHLNRAGSSGRLTTATAPPPRGLLSQLPALLPRWCQLCLSRLKGKDCVSQHLWHLRAPHGKTAALGLLSRSVAAARAAPSRTAPRHGGRLRGACQA